MWDEAWRPLALVALAGVACIGYHTFALLVPANGSRPQPYPVARLMLALLLPYGTAMVMLLVARGPRTARWRQVEAAILAGGAVLFPIPLLVLAPQSSPDVYRYAWDARLTAHGLSPYLHGPSWSGYRALHDVVLYPHVPWKDVPSIYPPGAQFFYWLVGLVAPGSIYGLKVEMALFHLLSGAVLALLLVRRGRDPRLAAIYLWAPLPIVEFALNGHVDAIAVTCILLALLLNTCAFRGARTLVGVALGVATLVKLYPLLLAVALIRRRDRAMPVALLVTILVGYARYLSEGPQALGFLSTYLTEVYNNYGGALLLVRTIGFATGATPDLVRLIGAALAGCCVAVLCWLRLLPSLPPPQRALPVPMRRLVAHFERLPRLDADVAACGLVVLWIAFSPHVFPWYVAVLLPFAALLLRATPPLAVGVWVFASFIPLAYVAFDAPPLYWFYPALYLAACAVALGIALARARSRAAPPLGSQAPSTIASLEKGMLP
jgi:hypothetical protein